LSDGSLLPPTSRSVVPTKPARVESSFTIA
jgi:hypothetical protein